MKTKCRVIDKRKGISYRVLGIIACVVLALTIHVSTEAHTQANIEMVETYSQQLGEQYGICPELIQAIVETESNYEPNVQSSYGAIGLMQVVPRWHGARMERLGVTDLTDPYGNMLVGTDYLSEIAKGHEVAEALFIYNHGNLKGFDYNNKYVQKVLTRSEELERQHGK